VRRESDAGMDHLSGSTDSMLPSGSPRKLSTARYHRPSIDHSNKHASVKSLPPQKEPSKSTTPSLDLPSPPLIISASALTYISKIKSYSYLYLRAKCRYLANDPEWAIHWLQIALAVCPKGKWDWRGKIRCLMGKSFVKLCYRCRNSSHHLSLDIIGSQNRRQAIENSFAASAEEEFVNAITLYKKNSDILKQIKCRNRILELHLSRLFYAMTVEGKTLQAACDDKGEGLLKSLENLCRTNLQQVGDTSTPLEMIRTLLNCTEISWFQGNHPLSSSSWTEARNLFTITYLQHITSETKQRQTGSTTTTPNPAIPTGIQHPSYVVTDANSPLVDIPVLAVPFSIGMLTKLFDILTRMIRIGFFIDPSPLNRNGSTLIGVWLRLNNLVKEHVRPLFCESQILHRSLVSYARVFNPSSPSVISPRLKEDTLNAIPRLVEEISRPSDAFFDPKITPLPTHQLRAHLSRPTMASLNRRSKSSSKSSNSLNESIGYILKVTLLLLPPCTEPFSALGSGRYPRDNSTTLSS
jgi:hypothetical protein